MKPFPTLKSVMDWWAAEAKDRAVGVLIDFSDIGTGLQRREIHRERMGGWVVGFPDARFVACRHEDVR